MKPKALLIYIVPVLLLLSTIYGYNIQDQPGTDLKSSNEYRESVLGNPPVMPFAIGDSCGGTGQEKHDDGSFENGGGWNNTVTDGRFVLKFRPPSYPWKYTKFCIALTRLATGSDSLKFDVVLFDSTGAGGLPGAQIGSLPNQTARPVLVFPAFSWFSFDLSSIPAATVNSGAIYIGIKLDASIASQANKFVMIDESAITPIWPGYAWPNTGGIVCESVLMSRVRGGRSSRSSAPRRSAPRPCSSSSPRRNRGRRPLSRTKWPKSSTRREQNPGCRSFSTAST